MTASASAPRPDSGPDDAAGSQTPAAPAASHAAARASDPADRPRSIILLALAAGAIYMIWRMLQPFFPAIVMSSVAAVLAFPAHRWFRARVGHPQVAAMIGTVIIFFLVMLPAVGLALLLIDQVRIGIEFVASNVNALFAPDGRIARLAESIGGWLGIDEDEITSAIALQAQDLAGTIANRTLSVFTGIGGGLLQAGVALFTLYYMLKDGERLAARMIWLVPLKSAESDRLFRRAREITYATLYGNILVAMAQGLLGGLTFWALGLPTPAFWGAVMGIFSLLPAIGAGLIWAPAAVLLLVSGDAVRGVLLLLIGALLISTVDNVLRALFVSNRAQMHPLVVFFSVLGGLFVFGAVGVFVGPVLFVIAMSLVELARLDLDEAQDA